MDYKFGHLKEQNVLLVTTRGAYSTTPNTDFLQDMHAAYVEFSCNRILIDYRESVISIDVVTALGRPAIYDSMVGIERPQKVILVFSALNEKYRYFEDVCQNRGWNLVVSDHYDSALKWITEE